jgi:YD repeat-containing protein
LEYHDGSDPNTEDQNVYKLTRPNQLKYRYDGTTGKLKSITDENGQAVTLTYDGSGRLTTVTDANPDSGKRRSLTFTYSGSSTQFSAMTDPLGRVWSFVYNSDGDLSEIKLPRTTDAVESRYVFLYDTTTDDGSASYYAHDLIGIGEPKDNPTSGSPDYAYSTEYDGTCRGVASTGKPDLGVRGMHGVYVNYGTSVATVVDQTNVTHQVTFSGGFRATESLISNPSSAEGSWTAGPTTTFDWDSHRNLIGARLPGNPTTFEGAPFWTITYDINDKLRE